MKDKRRPKTAMIANIDKLMMLHHEAADHLQMMHDLLTGKECLSGEERTMVGQMIMHHWDEYMDVMKMIVCEDHIMAHSMEQCNMDMRKEKVENPENADRQFGFFRTALFPFLLFSLIFRHRRRREFFGNYYRHGQFEDYLASTSHMECDHIANITTMLHDMM